MHLLHRLLRDGLVLEADESEALGLACFSVLCEEDTGDATEALEQCTKLVFFGEFGNLELNMLDGCT